jgi:hypothetical protein
MPRVVLPALAICAAAFAGSVSVRAADISNAMTADFFVQCSRNQETCREFANDVLRVLNAAVSLGQARTYKGCAPYPLSLEDTGKLIARMLARPQEMSGYAADDIGSAAQAIWPCK